MQKASFQCLPNYDDAGSQSGEGERILGRKSAPNPLCEMASSEVGCCSARSQRVGGESLIYF